MDYKEITELIKFINKSNISELRIEQGEFKIVIRSKGDSNGVQQPMMVSQPAQLMQMPQVTEVPRATSTTDVPAQKPAAVNGKTVIVKAPMVGTFYRSPGPDKEPFVKVGDTIEKGKPICIIEAMKLFNEIESEITGKVVRIIANDAAPVEYDQPLFEVEPA